MQATIIAKVSLRLINVAKFNHGCYQIRKNIIDVSTCPLCTVYCIIPSKSMSFTATMVEVIMSHALKTDP